MAYWLFKSEPDAWSWDQQKAKGEAGQQWDGVRNYQARNNMRAMAVGDRFTVLNRGQTHGTAKRGEIKPEELQDLMAGGQELAELEGSLGGTI